MTIETRVAWMMVCYYCLGAILVSLPLPLWLISGIGFVLGWFAGDFARLALGESSRTDVW